MPNLTRDLLTAAKFWVASGGEVISLVGFLDGNKYHWLPIIAQGVTALAVYFVPNSQKVVPPVPAPAPARIDVPPTGVPQ